MESPKIYIVGDLRIPVVVIDGFAKSTERLKEIAATSTSFSPERATYYPGQRANLPEKYIQNCLRSLVPIFYELYKIDRSFVPKVMDSVYSLISKKPNELEPVQTVPHFDTPSPNMIATVHYLNEGVRGGIGFFKHKETQFDYVDEGRKERYFKSLNAYFDKNDTSSHGYCTTQHNEFECHQVLEYKPNRLIAFPGYLLHSVIVNEKTDIDANPRTGRLTANLFLEFVAQNQK